MPVRIASSGLPHDVCAIATKAPKATMTPTEIRHIQRRKRLSGTVGVEAFDSIDVDMGNLLVWR